MTMITNTRQVGGVTIVDISGRIVPAKRAQHCASWFATYFMMIEMGEVPQEKVISKPEPLWKTETKTGPLAGTLKVQVVIDESGKVESAEIVDAPSALQDAALSAARKARFRQTMYQGQPVKVRGWLSNSYGMG
jgi:TonB family protein